MSDKDIQLLIDLAEEKLRAGSSREEALKMFIGAGIMDENAEYTEPYKQLLREAGIVV